MTKANMQGVTADQVMAGFDLNVGAHFHRTMARSWCWPWQRWKHKREAIICIKAGRILQGDRNWWSVIYTNTRK